MAVEKLHRRPAGGNGKTGLRKTMTESRDAKHMTGECVEPGETVTILDEDDHGAWAKVRTSRGKVGYAQQKYLWAVSCKRPSPAVDPPEAKRPRPSGVPTPQTTAQAMGRKTKLRLLQANLRGTNSSDDRAGNGWSKRAAGIANYIKEEGFAIVNMQECNGGMEHDLLRHLAGTTYRHCPNCTQRNRILYDSSRLKLIGEDYLQILGEHKPQGRRMEGYASRTLELCRFGVNELGGAQLRMGCTHFHHKKNGARSAQVLAGLDKSVTTIVSGDFNAKKKGSTKSDKNGESYAICSRAGWKDAVRDAPDQKLVCSTWNGFKHMPKPGGSSGHIDWVLYNNGVGPTVKPVRSEVVTKKIAGPKSGFMSDHLFLAVSFELDA